MDVFDGRKEEEVAWADEDGALVVVEREEPDRPHLPG